MELIDKYPYHNCKKVERKYKGNDDDFQEDAWREFKYNKEREAKGKTARYYGPLECFCEKK